MKTDKLYSLLLTASYELRGLAHLTDNQQTPEILPLDIEEVNRGVGMLVRNIQRRIAWSARQVDRLQLNEGNDSFR